MRKLAQIFDLKNFSKVKKWAVGGSVYFLIAVLITGLTDGWNFLLFIIPLIPLGFIALGPYLWVIENMDGCLSYMTDLSDNIPFLPFILIIIGSIITSTTIGLIVQIVREGKKSMAVRAIQMIGISIAFFVLLTIFVPTILCRLHNVKNNDVATSLSTSKVEITNKNIKYSLWKTSAETVGSIHLPKPQISTNLWKTYVNEKYGFSFKYPPDHKVFVEVEEFIENNKVVQRLIEATEIDDSVSVAENEPQVFCCEPIAINITATSSPQLTFDEFVNKLFHKNEWLLSADKIQRGFLFPKKYPAILISGNGGMLDPYFMLVIKARKGIIQINLNAQSEMLETILSTVIIE